MSPRLILTLSVTVTGLVLGLIFVGNWLQRTPRSIAHIESLGGTVVHDTRWGSTVYEQVFLNDTVAGDSDLKYVRQLRPCYGVYLQNTKITDEGLRYLHGLPLYEIDLTGTDVSDNAIDELLSSIPTYADCQIARPK